MRVREKEEIAAEHVNLAKELGLKQFQIKQLESICVQLHAKAVQLEHEWQFRNELDKESEKKEPTPEATEHKKEEAAQ